MSYPAQAEGLVNIHIHTHECTLLCLRYIYIYIYIYIYFEDNILNRAWVLFWTQLNGFKYRLYNSHNLASVICLHTVCSIWAIVRSLSGATTPVQSEPGSNSNEEVLCIPQISKAGASLSDGLMLYPGHSLRRSYPSAEIQWVYFTVPVDWAEFYLVSKRNLL